uniref:Uncharacterized protein n=1 Tax=Parascaris equorum TaxID=6256 RepID=A0A914RXB4_PAREQ
MNATDASLETAHEVPEGDSADNDMFVLGTNVIYAVAVALVLKDLLPSLSKCVYVCNRWIQGFMSVMGRLYPEWIRQQDALPHLFDAYIVPTYNSITVDEATQVIDALSAVHAHSLCNDSWLRISKADLKDLFVAINESPEV